MRYDIIMSVIRETLVLDPESDQSNLTKDDYQTCTGLISTQLQGFSRTISTVSDPTSTFYNISSRGFKSHPELYRISDLLSSYKSSTENHVLGDFLADGIGVTAQAIHLAYNSLKQLYRSAELDRESEKIIAATDLDNLPSNFRPQ